MADGSSFSFGSAPSPEELARYPMSNLGDAKRLIRLAGGVVAEDGSMDVRACTLLYQIGSGWVGFNGAFWDRDYGEELARRMAHKVAESVAPLYKELALAWPLASVKDITGYQRSCGSSGNTSGMMRQAQSYLTVKIDVFDRDPWAINCLNGTLKLRMVDGKLICDLRTHDPADRITKITAVRYEPDAKASLFKGMFADSFKDRPEEGAYFHRCAGYGATGLTREQVFFVCQGKGRDGKSTILDAVRQAMGSYWETGDVKTFLEGAQQSSAGPSPDLAKLSGDVRGVVLSEPKKGAVWDESRLKAWTSGSPVQARDLNAKPITFNPVGKLFVECNIFPKPKGDDDGFWRRLNVVLFRHQVPEDKVDKDLPKKIAAAELPGVLNWMLDGLEDYLKGGMRVPKALVDFISNYRRMASPLADWLEDCCVWGDAAEGCWTSSTELHNHFKSWCEDRGHDKDKVMSIRAFGDALTDRQVMVKKDRRGNKLRGPIRLKSPAELEAGRHDEPDAPDDAPPGAGGSSEATFPPDDDFGDEPGSFEPDEGDGQ